MSDVFISLMMAAGVSGWVFSKISRLTGGSTQRSVATAVIAAILTFMITMTVLRIASS